MDDIKSLQGQIDRLANALDVAQHKVRDQAAEIERMQNQGICTWMQYDDDWDGWKTDCDQVFTLNDGTPSENHMKYCCFCGKSIKEVVSFGSDEYDEEDEE